MAPADMDDVGSLQPGRPTRGEVARHAAWAVALALAVAYTFLSGTFSHPAGPLGYLHAFTPWAQRAGGTELHRHPWYYYVAILLWTHRAPGPVWSEGVIVGLALVGGAAAYTHRLPRGTDAGLARFLVVYTVALTAIYSAIPYKTPWLLLSFLSGAILLAGVGAVALLDWLQPKAGKAVIALALAAGCAQLGWLSCVTSFRYVDDTRNPYVYAQPLPGVAELGAMVTKLATFSPQREAMVVKVVSVDDYYWPLPWYLRRFPNVGYWTAMPADPEAPVVIASPAFDDALSLRLPNSVMTHIYPMRPGVFLELFARNDVWDPYVNSQPHRKLQIGE